MVIRRWRGNQICRLVSLPLREYNGSMSDATPSEPTPFEKLQAFTRQILSVPKSEIDRREAAWRKARKSAKNGKSGR